MTVRRALFSLTDLESILARSPRGDFLSITVLPDLSSDTDVLEVKLRRAMSPVDGMSLLNDLRGCPGVSEVSLGETQQ